MAVLTWPHNRVEQLKKLWEQIAAELGNVSRNAVIGKVHRLGLSGRGKSLSSAAPLRRKAHPAQHMMRVIRPIARGNTALAQAFEVEPDPVTSDNVVPMSQRLSLLELNEATCHWPIGDPSSPDFFFCGGKVLSFLARSTRASPKKRIAAKAIAEVAWRTLKLPILKQPIRHGIVVDRKKQICRKLVSGGHPLEQAWSCPTFGHQQHGAGEPIRYQPLPDPLT